MTVPPGRWEFLLVSFILLLIAGLFALDVNLPRGVASGVLYSIAVLFSFWSPHRRLCLAVAGLCTVLILLASLISPVLPGIPGWTVAANLLIGILVMWVPVLFYFEHIKRFDAQALAQEQLEARVQERTKDLVASNKALSIEVMERKQAQESLEVSQREIERSRQELRALADQLLVAQEDERRRISRELHDDINQRLAVLAIEVETAERRLSSSPEQTGRALRAIQDRIVELSDDVRHLAYQFHPSVLDDLGLSVALERLVEDVAARSGIKANFTPRQGAQALPQGVATCLYRVAQESLANVVKHAGATHVEVVLAGGEEGVTLTVRDDGKGFDVERRLASHTSLGLVSMQERVHLVNGTCRITSQPGQGTQVTVSVPLTKEST
jgi:signal transduction histidine kinase